MKHFSIVDLFSGPGGLAEGFSAFQESSGHHPFKIHTSIEMDSAAHATLRLRSFLRQFRQKYPCEYYEFLNGQRDEPDWSLLYPEEWRAAEDEARCMELGTGSATRFLKSRIAAIRKEYGNRTILIGGPPCQAYSLAGRSRNAGIEGYLPHKDDRNFLYQKYVDVLRQLKPAAFIMENVKGMLSSAIKGDSIFHKVMADLKSAAGRHSYRLMALAPDCSDDFHTFEHEPQDFIVRMEDYGIPQARHRVIILGLRSDLADQLHGDLLPRLTPCNSLVSVGQVIGQMPPLRSGLSRDDSYENWKTAIADAIHIVSKQTHHLPKSYKKDFISAIENTRLALTKRPRLKRFSDHGIGKPKSGPSRLKEWLTDPRIAKLPNNNTRGHMPQDLARYLFATSFAQAAGRSPKASEFPRALAPNHKNWNTGKFADRFRVQVATKSASTVTSHMSKDGHYFIHPDPTQCRSLTVREAARLQTFPDNYFFKGNRTQQYIQVGNAVPPLLALQIAESLWHSIRSIDNVRPKKPRSTKASSGDT
jgi:DNA (cytosine-5)-methyltransferase 1